MAMMSSSCLAYGLVLLKDEANIWEMEYQTQATLTTVEEQKRYKDFKKSPKSVTPEWREGFNSSVKSKYTVKMGCQADYGNHRFSNEGIIGYRSLKSEMDNLDRGLLVEVFEALEN